MFTYLLDQVVREEVTQQEVEKSRLSHLVVMEARRAVGREKEGADARQGA